MKTNILSNGGFENYQSNNVPTNWYSGGTGTLIINSTYKTNVHTGSYAGDLKAEGKPQTSAQGDIYPQKSNSVNLSQGINLSFWYNLEFPDITLGSYILMEMIVQRNGSYYYLDYYLSYNYFYNSNSTNYYYYPMNQTSSNTWLHFNRNITNDFQSLFGCINGGETINLVYFYVQSPNQATNFTELTLDDVSLNNSSSYNFIQNGNFESGTG